MVESILPAARAAVPATQNAPKITPPREFLNLDGSAVPDLIAYHHRPEDLGDMSDQRVGGEDDSAFFGNDGMTFGDLLDIINPLQHIPIISTIYRALTGDEISPGARIVGGALFGGPIGLGIAVVNAAVEASAGEDIGEIIMAALTDDAPAKTVQTAATAPPAENPVAATGADPALLRIGTMPISLLPKSNIIDQRPAARPQLAASAPPIATGLPFGGMGALPFGGMGALPFDTASQAASGPIAAVLRARSAVPLSGSVQGLGRAPLGQVERQSPQPAMSRPSALPVIDRRLSDKLMALAAKTAAQPPAQDDNRKPAEPGAGPAAARPQFVPTEAISQTMLNALNRYRQMKRAELGNLPS